MSSRLNRIEKVLSKIKNSDSELERIERNFLKLNAEAIEEYLFNGNKNVEFPEVPEHMKKRMRKDEYRFKEVEHELDEYFKTIGRGD